MSRLIQNFSRFSHFIKRQSHNADLRTGEIAILRCIMHHTDGPDGEIKPSQISALMGAAEPSITPSLRSLEERGYVRRRNSDQDRREVYFSGRRKRPGRWLQRSAAGLLRCLPGWQNTWGRRIPAS